MASRVNFFAGYYSALHNFSDFLEPVKTKKQTNASKRYFEVERVISRRFRKGNTEYLIKWKDFSSYECSWEDETHLTPDLISSFDRPLITQITHIQEHKDILLFNITVKQKSKSRSPHLFFFHHDIFSHFFFNNGTTSRDGKAVMLSSTDFSHLRLPSSWEQSLDSNGDGVVIQFPVRMQLHLTWSPKVTAFQDGKLVAKPRMPLEKLSVQFICEPFSSSIIS